MKLTKLKEINKSLIKLDSSIKEVVKNLNESGLKIALVIDNNKKLLGTIVDGDIRRGLLNGLSLDDKIEQIIFKHPQVVKLKTNSFEAIEIMRANYLNHLPIVDNNHIPIGLHTLDDVKLDQSSQRKNKVIIMAGGFGSRMDPITKVIPKPLVPIQNQTIIEHITHKFFINGFKKFYFSVGYKKNLIKAYFEDQIKKYKINYLSENKPLGTAGGLKALQGKISNSFFVTNCDSIFNIDYKKLYSHHSKNNFDITIVVSKRKFSIPYGVCDIKKNKKLIAIEEKPEFNFHVMTGMYILKPKILGLIPSKKFFNMDQLIKKSLAKNLSVGCYAISKTSWTDVGQLREYKKNVKNLS